jgi:hypothetical protein
VVYVAITAGALVLAGGIVLVVLLVLSRRDARNYWEG